MRKTKNVEITVEGRDKGKIFKITEMPAVRAEKWATRAFLAMAHAGVEVPKDVVDQGIAGLAYWGLQSLVGVRFEEMEPLLDEMLTCVSMVRDKSNPDMGLPLRIDDDIEETSTLVKLRAEVFQLHVDFSLAALKSTLTSAAASTQSGSQTLSTSQEPSAQ